MRVHLDDEFVSFLLLRRGVIHPCVPIRELSHAASKVKASYLEPLIRTPLLRSTRHAVAK